MIPVQQTRFGKDGNCFSACLASILELRVGAVPNFAEKGERWFDLANAWTAKRGLRLVAVPAHELERLDNDRWAETVLGGGSPSEFIAAGLGHYGLKHAVVMRAGKMVHDPHPGGEGLKEIQWTYFVGKR